MSTMRLDKYLADMSVGTRKEIKQKIKAGLVHVNGIPASRPEMHVDGSEEITVGGKRITYAAVEYYMLNKPAGVLSASSDKKARTVLDLIDEKQRRDLFPVGRLDKDTEGLLLICNDGELAHRLLSPARHVDKVYETHIAGDLLPDAAVRFETGMQLEEDWTTLPALFSVTGSYQAAVHRKENGSAVLSDGPVTSSGCRDGLDSEAKDDPKTITVARITLREGKFHQVKRMVQAVGGEVVYLKRLSMGSLWLDDSLETGDYRPLTEDEIKELKKLAGL